MRKIIFNLFLVIAVPVVTGFRFHVMYIGDAKSIAIVGNKTGLPALWNDEPIRKYWFKTKYLLAFERETERMSYPRHNEFYELDF